MRQATARSGRFPRLITACVLSVFFVAALGGCGSSSSQASKAERLSESEYAGKLLEIENSFYGPASKLYTDIVLFDPASSTPNLAGSVCAESTHEFAGMLHDVVDSVTTLTPPADVEGLQKRFLDEARVSVAVVDQAVRDVETGQLSCGRDMNARIYGLPSTDRAEAVLEELSAKGYLPSGD